MKSPLFWYRRYKATVTDLLRQYDRTATPAQWRRARIAAPFRAVAFGILSIIGAVVMAYSLRCVPSHDLASWWSCSIMTLIPASALLWYLWKGVPVLFRYIPINNSALVFMLMH